MVRANGFAQAVDAIFDLALTIGAGRAALFLHSDGGLAPAGERIAPSSSAAPATLAAELASDSAEFRALRSGQAVESRQNGDLALALPLTVEGEPVGVLSAHFAQTGPADPRMVSRTLISAGPTIAVALRHAMLLETARRREQDQAMLTAASRRFNSTLELDTILNDVARSAAQEIGDFAVVLLVKPGELELTVAAAFDRSPAIAALRQAVISTHPPRVDRGPLAEVIRERKIVSLIDPDASTVRDGCTIACCLAIPILYRGEVLGVLVVGMVAADAGGRQFGDRERALAASLADSAAPAIFHSGLFRTVAHEEFFLRSVLDNLPEAVLIIDADRDDQGGTASPGHHSISVLNLVAQQLFGGRLQAGASFDALMALDLVQNADGTPLDSTDNLFSHALSGETVTGEELLIVTEPRPVAVLASAAPLHNQDGEVTSVVAIMQDISERHQLEQNKDTFLAIAAHELRSPLTSLRGQLQLLERQSAGLPENLRRRIASANHAAQQLSDLAVRLLDVSRIGLGRLVLERTQVDIVAMIRDLAERTAPRLGSQHLRLTVPAEPISGYWDRQRLEEVLTNLIDNAARYSPSDGTIWIDVAGEPAPEGERREPLQVTIRVRDEGTGIAPSVLPHLFERYGGHASQQQVAGSEGSPRAGGLGLGLFICRSIVEAHGGTITVDSHPGEGATFTITLPRI